MEEIARGGCPSVGSSIEVNVAEGATIDGLIDPLWLVVGGGSGGGGHHGSESPSRAPASSLAVLAG